jgi:hypothetical protein
VTYATSVSAAAEPAQAGPLGLFVILLLGLATYFLIRSMNRHLRRVPPTFDPPAEPDKDPDPDEPRS